MYKLVHFSDEDYLNGTVSRYMRTITDTCLRSLQAASNNATQAPPAQAEVWFFSTAPIGHEIYFNDTAIGILSQQKIELHFETEIEQIPAGFGLLVSVPYFI